MNLLPFALLGAVCGLDVVSFPQAMISRPIVASTISGSLAGNAASGLLLGAVLELIALETLPFGASRYPEWGSASVVGGALAGAVPPHTPGALAIAMLAALATAWVGGWSMTVVRKRNATWARALAPELNVGSARAVVGLQLKGLTADFARGGLLTLVALLALSPLAEAVIALWHVRPRLSGDVIVGVAATVAVGATWKVFHGTRGAGLFFALGLAIGLALVALRQ
jgi:mannose/fructose/N-acetylgalactosamine-specific phosphotransferase system component IIC